MRYFRRRKRHVFRMAAVVLGAAYLGLCISMGLDVRPSLLPEEDFTLYYIVNADGMKGLGHSILMLVDEDGCGMVLSYNGMQRSLGESLLGKRGIGKMSVGVMTGEETEHFLQTGDLNLEEDQLSDNYDMALYRPITKEQFQAVLEQAQPYIAAGERFSELYGRWAVEEDPVQREEYGRELERMGREDGLPQYQIYTNNCDHVARTLISTVDPAMRDYMRRGRLTPNGNLKAFGGKAEDWGVMALGGQSLWEKILMFLMVF